MRYYRRRLEVLGVTVRLGVAATVDDAGGLRRGRRRDRCRATDPGDPRHRARALLRRGAQRRGDPGRRVAVIGAGGIGVDVSHWLSHTPATTPTTEDLAHWLAHWGVGGPDRPLRRPGRWRAHRAEATHSRPRGLPRAAEDLGDRQGPRQDIGLGPPGGAEAVRRRADQRCVVRTDRRAWPAPHRRRRAAAARGRRRRGVRGTGVGARPCTTTSSRPTASGASSRTCHLIGGADLAAELDAKRAIAQGMKVAAGA